MGNALVLVFVCSLALLSGETYFRFFKDTTDSFGLTKSTARWFERHFQNNSSGFRDSTVYTTIIPTGKKHRVTFIGDSFTAGHGIPNVEDRFANVIRRENPSWDVHVIAQCGWDTGHQLANVMDMSSDYQTDLVVLVYCLNDIADIVPEWQRILERVYSSPQPGFFFEHSYFLNTLFYRWKAAGIPDVSNYYQFVRDNYQGPVWDLQKQRLTYLRDMVHSRGGQFLVVTFPFLHALGPDYEYRTIHQRLDEFWNELDVPHLDLLSVYKSNHPHEVTVNAHDAHPNERAHKMAAQAIAVFLEKNLKN
ncbi:MAG: SGNH/GDSL hydrolase family protein [Planctomycetes bacterium]|nr:SGNH/GDSL hydrolase family protein [Planctomycetota bacterium]